MTPLADCFYDLDQLMRRVDEYPNLARARTTLPAPALLGAAVVAARPLNGSESFANRLVGPGERLAPQLGNPNWL